MGEPPPGWTDDMNVPLREGVTVDQVTDFFLQMIDEKPSQQELERRLSEAFGLSAEDANFVRDRICGGVVRAATGNPQNRPSRDKDPFAWTSFGRATADHGIITAMYPQYAPHLGHLKKAKPPEPS